MVWMQHYKTRKYAVRRNSNAHNKLNSINFASQTNFYAFLSTDVELRFLQQLSQ